MSSGVRGVAVLVRAGLVVLALAVASVLPLSASAQALTASRFTLTVGGVEVGSFAEVTGLTTEVEAADLTDATTLQKLPGKRKPPTLTLKRGKSSSLSVMRWASIPPGGLVVERKSATLVMYNTDGTPVARYYLENAWPVQVSAEYDASKNEVSIETLELAADSIQLIP